MSKEDAIRNYNEAKEKRPEAIHQLQLLYAELSNQLINGGCPKTTPVMVEALLFALDDVSRMELLSGIFDMRIES